MSVLSYEEALSLMIDRTSPLGCTFLPLNRAVGCHLFQDILATVNLPRFDNSQMDGFAVRSADTTSATPSLPTVLPIVATAAAGNGQELRMQPGTAVRIFTGAPMPGGADSVVPIEDVTVDESGTNVTFMQAAEPGQFVRRMGEDVVAGTVVLRAGRKIGAGELALLASIGHSEVAVFRKPRVAVLTNGDELVQPTSGHAPLQHGQIYESNSLMLAILAEQCGAEVVGMFSAKDSPKLLKAQFEQMSQGAGADLIISTGGVSVGDRDYIRSVVQDLGEIIFWRVAIRPGKPVVYGKVGTSHFLGLPGNPASSMVTFEIFARPLLSKLQGGAGKLPTYETVLEHEVRHEMGRRSFVRAQTRLTSNGLVSVAAGGQGSHFITSLAGANSLVILPHDVTNITAGGSAMCLLLESFASE